MQWDTLEEKKPASYPLVVRRAEAEEPALIATDYETAMESREPETILLEPRDDLGASEGIIVSVAVSLVLWALYFGLVRVIAFLL
jgi:hypothetical protein